VAHLFQFGGLLGRQPMCIVAAGSSHAVAISSAASPLTMIPSARNRGDKTRLTRWVLLMLEEINRRAQSRAALPAAAPARTALPRACQS